MDFNTHFYESINEFLSPHTKFKGVVIDNAAFSRDFHQYSPTLHKKNCLVSLPF